MYVNAHLGENADLTTALDFIPCLSGPTEMTSEVKAVYDQLAVDQAADKQRMLEKLTPEQRALYNHTH